MEYLDQTTAKESRRTESALCAISGKPFRKDSVITALVPKGDQKVGGKPVVEDKNKSLTYNTQENANEESWREKIESNNPGPTFGDADKVSKSSTVSSCGQTR